VKKNFYVTLGLLACIYSTATFAASDNTISFQGEVTDATCSLTVNGNSVAPIVLLPTIPASELAASGDVAGATEFEVGVSGCTGATTSISSVFVGNQVDTAYAGTLANTGTAKNVNIQILDTKSEPIDLTSGYKAAGDLSPGTGESSATATYKAQYFATGVATAGTVAASLQYAISYQ